MNVEVSKENICINKLIAEKKELVFVENDMIVPDTKPDILNTINITGNPCIYKKEILDDKVKIEGNIDTYIMYLPDSKNEVLRGLNLSLDFSQNIAVPEAKEGMELITKCTIKDMECKVINGRKITVKVGIEFYIKVYSNEDIEIINNISNVDDVQTLQEEFSVNSLVGSGKTSVYAKDSIKIDPKDELAEILKTDICLANKDLKFSYNKVLTKAEAEIKIMYLTEDNRIGRVDGKIPIIGFIDIQNITEENTCDVNYEIKSIKFKPNSQEEHSIYIELEVEPSVMAYEKKQMNLIQDLYSPTANMEYSQKRIMATSNKQENSKDFTIKDKVQIAGLEDGHLLDVEAIPILQNTKITNSKIIYSGEISLNFVFTTDNTLNSRNSKIPFEVSVENLYKTDQINVETEITVNNTNFEIKAKGEVNCEIEMNVLTKNSENVNINIIDNIEVSEEQNQTEEDYDSLIMYIVKPGDTLWKIAKNFNSTVNELTRMNGINENDQILVGQKIFIPKFNYIKKENSGNERDKVFV